MYKYKFSHTTLNKATKLAWYISIEPKFNNIDIHQDEILRIGFIRLTTGAGNVNSASSKVTSQT